jgi:hypothetical protein
LLVDGAVQGNPLAVDLQVGFIATPGIAHWPLVRLPAWFELRGVAHHQIAGSCRGRRARRVPGPIRKGLGN